MTDEQLSEIEQRVNAATPGSWAGYPSMVSISASHALSVFMRDNADPLQVERDNVFIAAARSDVPALVAEVRRLKNDNDMFAAFGRDVMKNIYDAGDWWADDMFNEYVLPIAEQHGLVMRVPYDPTIHGEGIDADEGEEIWWIDTAKWPASSAETERLRASIERIGAELATMRAANAELQERLSKFEDDGK